MQFTTPFLALLAAATTLASPVTVVPAKRDISPALSYADSLGVDLAGPIPDDFTSYNATEGKYEFTADSKAAAWVRAQFALADAPEAEKVRRQTWGNIGIGMFTQDWCGGNGAWFDNVQYGVHHYNNMNYFSVGISYRGLRANEHLDFSRRNGNDWCGTYVYSAAPYTSTGCWNSQLINCFRLWLS